jgi:hypothetical protein
MCLEAKWLRFARETPFADIVVGTPEPLCAFR